jgi:hypothetical protein
MKYKAKHPLCKFTTTKLIFPSREIIPGDIAIQDGNYTRPGDEPRRKIPGKIYIACDTIKKLLYLHRVRYNYNPGIPDSELLRH